MLIILELEFLEKFAEKSELAICGITEKCRSICRNRHPVGGLGFEVPFPDRTETGPQTSN